MRRTITAAMLVALSYVGPALADEAISYSYLEAGYVRTELDDFDVNGDGPGIRGSYALAKHVHGFAAYSKQDFDFDISADQWAFGAGVNFSLAERLDVVGTLAYVGIKLDAPGIPSIDDSGVEIGAELRGRVNNALELHGGVAYTNLNDSGDDTTGTAGARVYVTKMFALAADASFNQDGTTWMLGARLDFNHF
jgi:hypothetical protein